jgi:hypothetical protein
VSATILIRSTYISLSHSDQDEDFITYPFEDGDGLDTLYDWNLWTAPQTFLDEDPRPYDLGRGIYGGPSSMLWYGQDAVKLTSMRGLHLAMLAGVGVICFHIS